MADIFLSYAREDRDRAAAIAGALEQAGYKSFWDVEIPPGSSWADFLEEKLASSKAAIVLWSKTSTASQWVREEARLARDRGKLIPVIIDGSSPPFGFGEIQAANLSHWQGDQNDSNWRLLLGAVERAVGAGAQPRPAPQPQPAYAPPPVAPPPQTAYSPPPQNAAAVSPSVSPSPSPWGYFQKCLKPWINGKGRARRAEYWWFALFATAFMLGLLIVDIAITSTMGAWGPVLTAFGSLVLVGPAVSVAVRRLHDVGMNGWLYLLVLVPYAGALFLLVVALLPGQDKTNEYGPSPKTA